MRPLLPAESIPPKFSTWAAGIMKITGMSNMEEIRELYEQEFIRGDTFMNDIYTVIRTKVGAGHHLSIRRNDRSACKDWRHFQQIKNELCGPECEGVELYPAESRLIDTANQFHIWVLPAGRRFPVGYVAGRHVTGPDMASAIGATQREFET
jgi:hypothetical protein